MEEKSVLTLPLQDPKMDLEEEEEEEDKEVKEETEETLIIMCQVDEDLRI